MKKQNLVVSSLLCSAIVALSPSLLFSQTVTYNYWTVEEGYWNNSDNWSLGGPSTSEPATFGTFDSGFAGAQTAIVDSNVQVSQVRLGYGQAVHLQLLGGVTFTTTSSTPIGSGYGTGVGPASLRISATDAGNLSTFNFGSLIQIGAHQNGSDGNSVTLEGAGLRANLGSGTSVRIGNARNNNSLIIRDGAHFTSGSQIAVGYGTSRGSTPEEKGHGNSLIVDGTGTRVNVDTTLVALAISSISSGDTEPITGNSAEITNGAFMRVVSSSSSGTVQIATQRYVRNSSLTVSGAGSRLEIANTGSGLGIQMGAKSGSGAGYNDSRNNSITVSDGGTLKNEGRLEIYNTWGSAPNHMRIGSGGTYLGSANIENRGGIIYLENGGTLAGETADGSGAQTIALNLIDNGEYQASTLHAEGSGLDSTVNVNAGAGSMISLGNASNSSATALSLNSSIAMEADSHLQFVIFADSYGSIDFGATGSLSGATTLLISFAGYTAQAGDEWALFTGNLTGIDSNFELATSSLPTLADGLFWDLSRLNAEGNWVLGVGGAIPEPTTSAMLLGGGVLATVLFVRRRAKRKVA